MTVTDAADGAITSWSPDTWQALLGEHATVTWARAPDVSRGIAITFAPGCRVGARHVPTTPVIRCARVGAGTARAGVPALAAGRGTDLEVGRAEGDRVGRGLGLLVDVGAGAGVGVGVA